MKLRDYQTNAVKSTVQSLRDKKGNVIVAMPTGTGKSLVLAALVRYYAQYHDQRVCVLTHVKELITQDIAATRAFYPSADIGIYSAGLNTRDTKNTILFCGIASVYKRALELGTFDLVIIDECHLVPDDKQAMYRTFLNDVGCPVVGLSATPFRTSGSLVASSGLFDSICYDDTDTNSFNRLIKDGYLCNVVAKQPKTLIDSDSVKMHKGDFVESELQRSADKASVTRPAIAELIEEGKDRKHWLVFGCGKAHCDHIVDELRANGVSAASINYKTSSAMREHLIHSFKRGELKALVNQNVLTTGFDFPALDLIAVLRPTASAVLWIQMVGRGTRPYPGKLNCRVLDYGGNTARLGPINDVRQVDTKTFRRGKNKGRSLRARTCPECATLCPLNMIRCPECDKEFVSKSFKPTASTASIVSDKKRVPRKPRVFYVVYTRHVSKAGIPTLMVRYNTSQGWFVEWVCLEHKSGIRHKAASWWRRHTGGWYVPTNINTALTHKNRLRKPKVIVVEKNGFRNEIVDYYF